MNLEGLNVVISASINEFTNSMNQVEGRIGGLGGSMGKMATVAGVAIGAVVTALGTLATITGTVGVKYNATAEQSQVAWTTLLGTQGEALDMMKRISDFAKATPFETQDVDMMAKYMHNAGLEGQGLFDALMKVSDVASAFAVPASEAKEMTRQMSQVRQAGVAYTEDLNILQDRGVPIYKAISEQLGITVADVKKMASEGKLTSDIYIKAFDSIANKVKGASDAQSQTFNGMISTMKDNLDILAGALAKPLFEKMKAGMETLMPILEGLTSWAKGDFQGFADKMTETFGASMGGKIVAFASGIATAFGTLQEWAGKGKQALQVLFEYLSGDNIGAIDIMTKMGLSTDKIVAINNTVNTIKANIKAFVDAVVGYFKGLFSGDGNVGESFIRIFNVIKGVALPILEEIRAFIGDKLAQIKAFWSEHGEQVIQAVQNFWSVIASIFEFLAPVIMFVVKFVWDTIKGIINGAINVIIGIIKVFTGIFTGDWSLLWEGIKQILSGAIELIWNLLTLKFLKGILTALKSFGTSSVAWFKDFGTKFVQFFKNMWDDIWKGVQKWVDDIKTLWSILRGYGDTIFQAMKQIIKNIWDDIVNAVKGAVTKMKDTVVNIFNAIKSTGQGIFNGAKQIFTSIWEGLKSGVTSIVNAIKTTVVNVFNGIRSASSIWEAMKNAVMAVVNGLKSGATGVFNALKSTISGIWNGIKTAITSPIESAKKTVLGIIDAIKGAFSRMNITIPKPKLPKVSVSMKKGVMGIPYPDFDVSWHKDGGIFTGASVVGLGEAGPEAIVPLQGHRMKPFAETIAKQMPNGGNSGSGLTVHVAQMVVREEADIKRVAQELHGLQERNKRQGGRG